MNGVRRWELFDPDVLDPINFGQASSATQGFGPFQSGDSAGVDFGPKPECRGECVHRRCDVGGFVPAIRGAELAGSVLRRQEKKYGNL